MQTNNFISTAIKNLHEISHGIKRMIEQEKQYDKDLCECVGIHESLYHNDNHEEERIKPTYSLTVGNIHSIFVLSNGETYTVREFIERCFAKVGKEIEWKGEGLEEVGREKRTGKIVVKIDEKYFRPCEVDFLLGDATKAETELGWKREYDLDMLIDDMMR